MGHKVHGKSLLPFNFVMNLKLLLKNKGLNFEKK